MVIRFIKNYKDPRRGTIKKGKHVDCMPEYGNARIKEGYAEEVEQKTFQDAIMRKLENAEETKQN